MTAPQVQRAHEMPFTRQFSVFLPNQVGKLHELLAALEEARLELLGLCVFDSTDWAVVRMIFSEPDKAREVFTKKNIAFTECEILCVALEAPKTLQDACKALLAAELNVHFAYPLLVQSEGRALLAMHVDDHIVAAQALTRHGFTLLGHEDM